MPLLEGDFDNINDQFVLKLDAIQTVTAFNFFQDQTSGESPPDKDFKKEFRWSRDGFVFSLFISLTDGNLMALDTSSLLEPWFLEIRYTRIGTDSSGTLEWDFFYLDVDVDVTASTTFCPNIFTSQNLFCDIEVDDLDLVELCGNLLDKIIKYGIVPKFISNDVGSRTDAYIEYWKTVCCWFALHFVHAKKFADMFEIDTLLAEYLKQRGVFLCGDETLSELQDLARNYYSDIRRRGTEFATIEIKRLLCRTDCDEFIFALVPQFQGGWVLDRASPMYQGNCGIETLDEDPELGDDIVSKTNYHLINGAAMTIVTDTDNDGESVEVFDISGVTATTGLFQTGSDKSLLMTIDPLLNYEIGFFVKQEVLGSILSFGVKGYDCDENEIANPFEEIVGGTDEQFFFQTADVIDRTDKYIQIRGIIYNKDEPNKTAADGLLKFGYGTSLRFKSTVVKIYPIVTIENGVSVPGNVTKFYGYKTALASNEFSLGFIGLANMILAYYNNGNPAFNDEEVRKIIDKFLIPANAVLQQTPIV